MCIAHIYKHIDQNFAIQTQREMLNHIYAIYNLHLYVISADGKLQLNAYSLIYTK